jgi:RNA polymerase sigma factor (sigma-70 family)
MYSALRPAVYRSAYSRLHGDVGAAEDVTQNSFLRFLKYADLDALQSDEHLLAYLRQTARHLCWDYQRSKAATVSIESAEVKNILSAEPDSAEELRSLAQDIEQLGQGLTVQERALLSDLANETPMAEIAAKFGITYGAAAVRVHRLRERIRLIINDLQ